MMGLQENEEGDMDFVVACRDIVLLRTLWNSFVDGYLLEMEARRFLRLTTLVPRLTMLSS
jgi:hypothetical protein